MEPQKKIIFTDRISLSNSYGYDRIAVETQNENPIEIRCDTILKKNVTIDGTVTIDDNVTINGETNIVNGETTFNGLVKFTGDVVLPSAPIPDMTIGQLSNVDTATGLVDKQILIYDAASQCWKNNTANENTTAKFDTISEMSAGNGTSINGILMTSGKVTAASAKISSFTTAGVIHSDASGNLTNSSIVNSDITNGTITDAKLSTITTAGKVSNSATTATDANTPSTIMLRNTTGDTKVNNLTANTVLTGTLKSSTTGNLAINSNGNVFIDIDNDNNESGSTFNITTNKGTSSLFQINDAGKVIIPTMTSANVVHSTATGELAVSKIVTDDITDGAITDAKIASLSIPNAPSTIVQRDANGKIYCATVVADKVAPTGSTLSVPAAIACNSVTSSGNIVCNGNLTTKILDAQILGTDSAGNVVTGAFPLALTANSITTSGGNLIVNNPMAIDSIIPLNMSLKIGNFTVNATDTTFENSDNTTFSIKSKGNIKYHSDYNANDSAPNHAFSVGASTMLSIYGDKVSSDHPVCATLFASNTTTPLKIAMYESTSTNWGMYISSYYDYKGTGIACTSPETGTTNAFRLRVYDNVSTGIIFENSNNVCNFSSNANTGAVYVRGLLTAAANAATPKIGPTSSTTLKVALKYDDNNWGIYQSLSGANRDFAGTGTACAGFDLNDALRIRTYAGTTYGLIYENSNNVCNFSANGASGAFWVRGKATLNGGLQLPNNLSGYLYSDGSGNVTATTVTSTSLAANSGSATNISSTNNLINISGDTDGSYFNANNANYGVVIKAGGITCMNFGKTRVTSPLVLATAQTTGDSLQVYIDTTGKLHVPSSSIRYKTNVVDMEDTSYLYRLRPVNFNFKDDTKRTKCYGLIAEECKTVCPELVYYKDGVVEGIRQDKLPFMMLNEMQKLKSRCDALTDENTSLKAEIEMLKTTVAEIKQMISVTFLPSPPAVVNNNKMVFYIASDSTLKAAWKINNSPNPSTINI